MWMYEAGVLPSAAKQRQSRTILHASGISWTCKLCHICNLHRWMPCGQPMTLKRRENKTTKPLPLWPGVARIPQFIGIADNARWPLSICTPDQRDKVDSTCMPDTLFTAKGHPDALNYNRVPVIFEALTCSGCQHVASMCRHQQKDSCHKTQRCWMQTTLPAILSLLHQVWISCEHSHERAHHHATQNRQAQATAYGALTLEIGGLGRQKPTPKQRLQSYAGLQGGGPTYSLNRTSWLSGTHVSDLVGIIYMRAHHDQREQANIYNGKPNPERGLLDAIQQVQSGNEPTLDRHFTGSSVLYTQSALNLIFVHQWPLYFFRSVNSRGVHWISFAIDASQTCIYLLDPLADQQYTEHYSGAFAALL